LVENVQNGTKMGGGRRGIAAVAAGGNSDTDREAGHSGTAARRHGRDKGKRGHDVVVPLPEAAVLAVLAVLEGSGVSGNERSELCRASELES
jgi:hypothetical protein